MLLEGTWALLLRTVTYFSAVYLLTVACSSLPIREATVRVFLWTRQLVIQH